MTPSSSDVSCRIVNTGQWSRVFLRRTPVTSGTQKFPNVLWNPEVQYVLRNSLPRLPILSQMTQVHTTPSNLTNIHFNISSHLRLSLSCWSLLFQFIEKNPAPIRFLCIWRHYWFCDTGNYVLNYIKDRVLLRNVR
jgi:hypothetical protein